VSVNTHSGAVEGVPAGAEIAAVNEAVWNGQVGRFRPLPDPARRPGIAACGSNTGESGHYSRVAVVLAGHLGGGVRVER